MNSANRRGFLKIAGTGAAVAGAASIGTGTLTGPAAAAAPPGRAASLPAGASGSMVAYVDDVTGGDLVVMVEGHEITVTDHDLIARLATAVHAASTSSSTREV